jgi:hypothetical protein
VGETDVTGVAVMLRTGARVTGRLQFDGAAAKPAVDRMMQASVIIDAADGRTTSSSQFTMQRGVIDAAGNFKTYQLPGGRYVIRGPAYPSWTFKGAYINGRDVSDSPLELDGEDVADVVLMYTDRPTDLIGTARNDKGPDPTATVLLFPAEPNLWVGNGPTPRRMRLLRAGVDGVFRSPNVPAGDYMVVAVSSVPPAEWQDPSFLRKLMPLATRVSLADGESKTVDVTSKEIK